MLTARALLAPKWLNDRTNRVDLPHNYKILRLGGKFFSPAASSSGDLNFRSMQHHARSMYGTVSIQLRNDLLKPEARRRSTAFG